MSCTRCHHGVSFLSEGFPMNSALVSSLNAYVSVYFYVSLNRFRIVQCRSCQGKVINNLYSFCHICVNWWLWIRTVCLKYKTTSYVFWLLWLNTCWRKHCMLRDKIAVSKTCSIMTNMWSLSHVSNLGMSHQVIVANMYRTVASILCFSQSWGEPAWQTFGKNMYVHKLCHMMKRLEIARLNKWVVRQSSCYLHALM